MMTLARFLALSFVVSLAAACHDEPATPAEEPAFTLELAVDVAPHTEAWMCWVGPLHSLDEAVAVRKIESWQTPGMHHMDLAAIDFVDADIAPGLHDCNDLYAEVPSLMEDMMTLYGAQEEHQAFELPEGVAAVLPGVLNVMFEIHFVNASDVPVTASAKIAAWSMPVKDVEEGIWGTVVRDNEIAIPPMSRTTEWTRCTMTDAVDLLAMSSHTHQYGKRVAVHAFDGAGETTKIPLYVNEEWDRPLIKEWMQEPVKVAAGAGFEFRCEYENATDLPVAWGFTSEDEMCSMTLVFTPGDLTIDCTVVDSGTITSPL